MEWFLPGKMDFPEGSTSFLTDLSELLRRALFIVMARLHTQAVIAHRCVSCPADRSGPCPHPSPGSSPESQRGLVICQDGITAGF